MGKWDTVNKQVNIVCDINNTRLVHSPKDLIPCELTMGDRVVTMWMERRFLEELFDDHVPICLSKGERVSDKNNIYKK